MAQTGKRKEKEPFPIWLAGVIGAIFLLLMFVGMNRNTSPAAPGGRALPNVTNATGNATADGTAGEVAFFTNETALSSSPNLTYSESDGLTSANQITTSLISGNGESIGSLNISSGFNLCGETHCTWVNSPVSNHEGQTLWNGNQWNGALNTTNHSIVNGFLKVGNQEWTANDVFGITNGFGGGIVFDGYDDGYGRGASMLSTRRNYAAQPFFVFSAYDLDNPWEASGAQRQIWFGSFGTNQPDATDMLFTTSESYAYENPQSAGQESMTMARMHMGKMWIGTQYYLPTYAMDGSIPRYKLDVGDGDVRIRDTYRLGFGGTISSDYGSSIYQDGTYMQFDSAIPFHFNNMINITGGIAIGSEVGITKNITIANATGTCDINITGGIITGTTC